MDKRLEKTIKEEEKLKEQLKALQDRINDVEVKRESFEKKPCIKHLKKQRFHLKSIR